MVYMNLFIRSGETKGRTDKSDHLHTDRAATNELLHPPKSRFPGEEGV